jgi:hypothetical protein
MGLEALSGGEKPLVHCVIPSPLYTRGVEDNRPQKGALA